MDVSYIVFAGIIVAGISVLPLVLRGIYKIFKMIVRCKEKQEEKIDKQEISNLKDKLKIAVNSGSLSDLINAADDLGDKKLEKIRK